MLSLNRKRQEQSMAVESEIATNIHRLSSVLGRIADHALQDAYGFGMAQFRILWVLHKHSEGVLQTNIANWCNQTEAAISRQIRLLRHDRLIERHIDPQNRRNHIIKLTPEGRTFATGAMKLLAREYKPFFAVLEPDEQASLNLLLEKLFFTVATSLHD